MCRTSKVSLLRSSGWPMRPIGRRAWAPRPGPTSWPTTPGPRRRLGPSRSMPAWRGRSVGWRWRSRRHGSGPIRTMEAMIAAHRAAPRDDGPCASHGRPARFRESLAGVAGPSDLQPASSSGRRSLPAFPSAQVAACRSAAHPAGRSRRGGRRTSGIIPDVGCSWDAYRRSQLDHRGRHRPAEHSHAFAAGTGDAMNQPGLVEVGI